MYANLPQTLQVNIYCRTKTILQAQLVQLAERLTRCWRSWVRSLVRSKAFWWRIFCLMPCPLHHSSPLNWPGRGLQHGTGGPQRACCDKTKSKHSPNQCQTLQLNQVQTNAKPIFIKTCKPMSNLVQTINKLGATARQALSKAECQSNRTLRQMEKQPNHG